MSINLPWFIISYRKTILGGLIAIPMLAWAVRPVMENSREIQDEWASAMAPLGIASIYPPTEDIAVGDLFAIIVDRPNQGTSFSKAAFGTKSIKLTHVDVSKELDDVYKNLIRFKRAEIEKDSTAQADGSRVEVFKKGGFLESLPSAVLPGYITAVQSAKSLGAPSVFSELAARLGISFNREELVRVSFDDVLTYGLTSLLARGKLEQFCATPETRFACSEASLRSQLSQVAGSSVFDVEKSVDGLCSYKADVAIILISRLYLAGAITVSRQKLAAKNSNIGKSEVGDKIAQALNILSDEKIAAVGWKDAPDELRSALKRRQLAAENAQKILTSLGSAEFAAHASASYGQFLSVQSATLRHPVAVGYKSIIRGPSERAKYVDCSS